MGSPDFAVPTLRRIAESDAVAAVVTQPDRPRGRGRKLASPPVKAFAERLGVPVLQPDRLRDSAVVDAITRLAPDAIVVAAYGHILPPAILAVPRHGCFNVHASLLPRWRGAAPVQRALMAGDASTGVTIMRMEEGLDTGPMIAREEVPIGDEDTAGTLEARLAEVGAALLTRALRELEAGTAREQPQDRALATYAPKITKEDARLDFSRAASEVRAVTRAMDPRPGAFALLGGAPLRLFRPTVALTRGEPGAVLRADTRLIVACSDGAVAFGELQAPGGRRMPAAEFLRGHGLAAGTKLG